MPAWIHEVMKPSILPPSMSLAMDAVVCGPPWSMSFLDSHGRVHPWVTAGLGTQMKLPFASVGIPSAPGNVPKYWSNERFSCITMMMCLSLPPLGSVALVATLEDLGTGPDRVAIDGPPLVHATNAMAATVVATANVRRIDLAADISERSPEAAGGRE